MNKKTRILIVDDHFLLRIGLATSVNSERDLTVVAEAGTAEQALELYRKHQPDVVLMDLRLPDMGGDEATTALCKEFPKARVIIVSSFDGQDDIYRSMQAGAKSYLPKNVLREELLRAIRAVQAGENYLPPTVAARLVQRMHSPELSAREAEVLTLVVDGLTNKEIALALAITEITVKNHVSSILTKLNATDRTQASTIAIQRGIVHLD
jgi:two-component system NarL family response regulator